MWKIWLHTPNPGEMEMGAVEENLWWKQGYPAITILDFFSCSGNILSRFQDKFDFITMLSSMFPVIGYTLDSGINVGVRLLIFRLFSSGYLLIKLLFSILSNYLLFQGAMFIVFSKCSKGYIYSRGGTSTPESRVTGIQMGNPHIWN